jgi:crotonobetainyl-CoA:carnitine CoA-transferase CaiB-like acyl-CoA transferase
VLGDAALAADPRLDSNLSRVNNRVHVDQLITAVFSALDQQQAIERLQLAGIAFGRLNDMAGLARHPQLRRVAVDTPSGPAEVVAVAAIHERAAGSRPKVPALGEHSRALRAEFS